MPHHARPSSAALGFDEALYLAEALHFPLDQHEDGLDATFALRVPDKGAHDPFRSLFSGIPHTNRALSVWTMDSDYASSVSVASQDTQSTGFNSARSCTSRELAYSAQRSSALRIPSRSGSAAPSLHHNDSFHARTSSALRRSNSPSSLATGYSLPAPAIPALEQCRSLRTKRSATLFSMFRKERSIGTSPSTLALGRRQKGDRFDCGHSPSALALRMHVQEALESGSATTPSCYRKPLSPLALQSISSEREIEIVRNTTLSSRNKTLPREPDFSDLDSISSPPRSSYNSSLLSPMSSASSRSTLQSMTCKSLSWTLPQHDAEDSRFDTELAKEASNNFRAQQKLQFDRASLFECKQRKALEAHHQYSIKQLTLQHTQIMRERIEQHSRQLEQLEEIHLNAEYDYRTIQEQEAQNAATAIKHMEAYCLGTAFQDVNQAHVASEDDFKKLDRQRALQVNLPQKFQNSINILRAKQDRETNRKLQKQQDELDALRDELEKQKATEAARYKKDVKRLENVMDQRRRRGMQRWDLKVKM